MAAQNNRIHLKNRIDIDGLRGLSILLVLLFHVFPESIPGGFIGVDIFYVISGFLITSLIFKSLEENRFSFLIFYIRRVKRLFPALICVLITFYILGWFILINSEYINFGRYLVASATFMNNLLLWRDATGYFGGTLFFNPLLQPLLHLWSLGVEEQFYLIWPPIIWFARKKNYSIFKLLMFIMIGSFILNIYWSRKHPVAAFYSPFTRFWEPLMGAYLAYITFYRSLWLDKISHCLLFCGLNKERLKNAQSTFGFCLIFIAALLITSTSEFPGWVALAPTAGAGLIISGGSHSIINRTFLSNRLIVWFGKISYPLYLWHWPILSFAFIYNFEPVNLYVRLACIGLSIVLAWGTWRYIEKPIRFGTTNIFIPIILCIFMLLIGLVGFITYMFDGFPGRFPLLFKVESNHKAWREGVCLDSKVDINTSKKLCVSKGASKLLFLWGDSNAAALYPGLHYFQEKNKSGLAQFTLSACPPILNYNPDYSACKTFNDRIFGYIKDLKPNIVLLESTWGYGDASLKLLRETIKALHQTGIKRIILVGSSPIRSYSLPSLLFHHYFHERKPAQLPLYLKDYLLPVFYNTEPKLRKLAIDEGIEYISIYDQMCKADGCLTLIKNKEGNQVITSIDGGHLSTDASIWLVQKIHKLIFNDHK